MKLSQLVQEHNLFCSEKPRVCPDGLGQYVWNATGMSFVITQYGSIYKILDDHANLSPLLS